MQREVGQHWGWTTPWHTRCHEHTPLFSPSEKNKIKRAGHSQDKDRPPRRQLFHNVPSCTVLAPPPPRPVVLALVAHSNSLRFRLQASHNISPKKQTLTIVKVDSLVRTKNPQRRHKKKTPRLYTKHIFSRMYIYTLSSFGREKAPSSRDNKQDRLDKYRSYYTY